MPAPSSANDSGLDASEPEVMRRFYQSLFPFKQIFHWLNHDQLPTRQWTHREIAFSLPGDIYIRYNSFQTADDFKKEVLRMNPSRFEIGAVYTARPKDKKTLRPSALQPARRELVFDIDMTDYDEIRTCCQDKKICRRCWGFIACATEVLDQALREQFGYEHLLWVYSGRRGIHCWVSDSAALDLTDDQRRAVINYMEVISGGKEMAKKVNVRFPKSADLHPTIKIAYDQLSQEFPSLILDDQECFQSKEQADHLLLLLNDLDVAASLRSLWASAPASYSSRQRWRDILKAESQITPAWKRADFHKCLEDIILQYTYPRLDADVSKKRNHLLKSPFCVHPGTNKICVPLDPKKVKEFDPDKVPTVGQLLTELAERAPRTDDDAAMDGSPPEKKVGVAIDDWKDTSLRPYVEMLVKHNLGLMRQQRDKKRGAQQMSMDF